MAVTLLVRLHQIWTSRIDLMGGLSLGGSEMTLSSMRLYGSIYIAEGWLVDAESSKAPRSRFSCFTWTLHFSGDFSSVVRMSWRIQFVAISVDCLPLSPQPSVSLLNCGMNGPHGPHQKLAARL